MEYVSSTLFATSAAVNEQASKAAQFINGTGTTSERIIGTSEGAYSIWARGAKTDPARLQNQMFAFTVTQQAIGTFTEVGLPFITRKIEAMRFGSGSGSKAGKATGNVKGNSSSTKTETSERKGKRVVFDDEESGNKDEREFLAVARHEASLPNYELFADYSEMVTQFGYVALWSTIWPLAPGEYYIFRHSLLRILIEPITVMALLNNWLELRSDAFKIATHVRRPLPSRTDTIGPWLDNLVRLNPFLNLTLFISHLSRTLELPSMALGPHERSTCLPLPSRSFLFPTLIHRHRRLTHRYTYFSSRRKSNIPYQLSDIPRHASPSRSPRCAVR